MAKISIDCDGVLANFLKAFAEEANHIWPGRFPKDYWQQHKQWDFPADLISKAEVNQVWERIKTTPDWWMRLDPHGENIGVLAIFFWMHRGHDVYIVTSRVETEGHTVAWQTDTWLRACGVSPCHNYLSVISVPNSNEKIDIYRAMQIDFSIDDKGETVEQCQQLKSHIALLQDRPWNQDAKVKHRVKSVQELFDLVDKGTTA
jgi:hypothetical protein